MKNIIDYISEHIVKTHIDKDNDKITFDKFKRDIEKIFKENNLDLFDDDDQVKQELFVKHSSYNSYEYGATIDRYNIYFYDENEYCKKNYGYGRDTAFNLDFNCFYDKEQDRPRYFWGKFGIMLPHTNHQGYWMDYSLSFPRKKVTIDTYNVALDSIREIVKIFVKGVPTMEQIFKDSKKKNKNPQKTDFNKVMKVTYKPYFDKLYS